MIDLHKLARYRLQSASVRDAFEGIGDEFTGIFIVPSKIDKADLKVIAASALGWDHVSVSRKNRCPNWPEMSQIKRLFFLPCETVVQFHVPEDQHINLHPFTLHLWRSWSQEYHLPPPELVGPANINPEALKEFIELPSGLFKKLMKRKLINEN